MVAVVFQDASFRAANCLAPQSAGNSAFLWALSPLLGSWGRGPGIGMVVLTTVPFQNGSQARTFITMRALADHEN